MSNKIKIQEIGSDLAVQEDIVSKKKLGELNPVCNMIVQGIFETDFLGKYGCEDWDKVPKKKVWVDIVNQVINSAVDQGLNICKQNGSILIYDGRKWSGLTPDECNLFLLQAALRAGVDPILARTFSFREGQHKQLAVDIVFPAPVRNNDSVLINCLNGTLEINMEAELKLRDFSPSDFLTYVLPYNYDDKAKAPLFQSFLDRVLPESEAQAVLSEVVALAFTNINLEKIGVLYGQGANGKSVFANVIRHVMGEDNVTSYSLASLADSSGYYRACLDHKLLNYATEGGTPFNSDFIKQIASHEPLQVRRVYCEPYVMKDYARVIVNCNVLPSDIEATNAFLRRFLVIPFSVMIPEDEQDPDLARKIYEAELPGVLNWILAGLKRIVQSRHFTYSPMVEDANREFRLDADTVAAYLEERGYAPYPQAMEIYLIDMYRDYEQFCSSTGRRALKNRSFAGQMRGRGFVSGRSQRGVYFLAGLRDEKK